MFKKLISIVLILGLVTVSLAGCSGKEPQTPGTETGPEVTTQPTQGTQTQPTEEPTKEPTPVPATPTPTEVPKPEGKTYEDGFKSPVAGSKDDFDADAVKADGFTVVTTAQEFIDAIRPGAKIVFAPGTYNLTDYTEGLWNNSSVEDIEYGGILGLTEWTELVRCFDGVELKIKDVDGLVISGGSEVRTETELVISPRYAAVLVFDKCKNIELANLTMGHTDTGDCTGNVVDLYRSESVRFHNTDIYGCGVYGIGAYNGSADIHVYNSKIHDCSYGAIDYDWGMGLFEFIDCELVDTAGLSYSATAYSKLRFERCTLGDWETTALMFRDDVEHIDCIEGEMVGEYPDYEDYGDTAPYWYGQPFDPSTFDFDSMEEAYDDEYIAAKPQYDYYSSWTGYMKVQSATGRTTYLPSYDVAADAPVYISCGFRFPDDDDVDGKPEFYLSIGEEYYQGTWYYDSVYSAVLQLNENEDGGRYGGMNAYVSVYRDMDVEGSHPWLMLQLGNDVYWLY